MISEAADAIGSRAATIAVLYPVAVGLYAVGFFWELPNDIIGLFDIGAFLFKASIVYLSAISAIFLVITLSAIVYSPVLANEAAREEKREEVQEVESGTPWSTFSERQKRISTVAMIAMLALFCSVAYIDPPEVDSTLDLLMLSLGAVFFGAILLRPFIPVEAWKAGSILFMAAFLLVVPILTGNSDSQPNKGSPVLVSENRNCPVIYVTKDLTVADCGATIAIEIKDSDEIRVWTKEL